jgi:hypothetical protein
MTARGLREPAAMRTETRMIASAIVGRPDRLPGTGVGPRLAAGCLMRSGESVGIGNIAIRCGLEITEPAPSERSPVRRPSRRQNRGGEAGNCRSWRRSGFHRAITFRESGNTLPVERPVPVDQPYRAVPCVPGEQVRGSGRLGYDEKGQENRRATQPRALVFAHPCPAGLQIRLQP